MSNRQLSFHVHLGTRLCHGFKDAVNELPAGRDGATRFLRVLAASLRLPPGCHKNAEPIVLTRPILLEGAEALAHKLDETLGRFRDQKAARFSKAVSSLRLSELNP